MNIYEAMYILVPELDEQAFDTEIERLVKEIQEKGGEIISTEKIGKKQLAYEIKKQNEGNYVLIYFKLDGPKIDELKQKYSLDATMLRYMILNISENQLPQPEEEKEEEVVAEAAEEVAQEG